MRGFGRLLLPWLLGLIFIVSCSTTSTSIAGDNNKPQPQATIQVNSGIANKDCSKLLSKAQAAGSVHVIVRLNIPFVPDGQLSATEATDQQAQISRMQDQLCKALSNYNVTGIKRFKYTPYIALEVDSAALKALMANSLVASIGEDVPVPPASNQIR